MIIQHYQFFRFHGTKQESKKRLIFGYGVTTTTHIHHLRRLPYTNVITKMQEKIKALPNNFEYLVMQRN